MNTDSDVKTMAAPAPAASTDAATYASLFADDPNQLTAVGAIDDETGPVAYLVDLYALGGQLESGADKTKACLLAKRRPDLAELVVDNSALHQECPTISLVNNLMERCITACTGDSSSIEERMRGASTPTGLPYDAPWDRVVKILQQRGISLWRATRHTDPEFPAFVTTQKPSTSLRDAVTMGCGFPPCVRKMLVGPAMTTDAAAVALFSARPDASIKDLRPVKAFMEAAQLSRRDIRHLLAVSGVSVAADAATAVSLGTFAPEDTGAASCKAYGAAFVNSGNEPLWIQRQAGSTDATDTEIAGLTAKHLDRIHRLLQVRARMGVSFADADLLLRSALNAEKAAADALPTERTLRALGLYGHMAASTAITPASFAALIDKVSPYGIGRTPALLDSLIKITGKAFTQDDTTALATALRIDATLLEQVLKQVEAVQATRACTLPVVSACYRLVLLPRLLGISVQEGLALLDMLEQQTAGYAAQIAGTPTIVGTLAAFDILDVIPAYWNATEWARRHRLSFIALKALSSETVPTAASDKWLAAVSEAARALTTKRLDTQTLADLMKGSEGGYDLAGRSWHQILAEFTDGDGIISATARNLTDPELREGLAKSLNKLKKPSSQPRTEDYVSKLSQKIRALDVAQDEAVTRLFQMAFDLDAAQTLAIMSWADASRAQMLGDVVAALKKMVEGTVDASTFSSDTLKRWQRVHRLASLARKFDLSGACLDHLVKHPAWFNVDSDAGKPASTISLALIYRLSCYQDWVGSLASGLNEGDALKYLSRAHAKPAPAVVDAAAQLARLLGSTPGDIEELAKYIGQKTVAGVAEDVADIDYLMRLLALQAELGISVATLRDLNGMKGSVDAAQVKRVAAGLGTALDDTQRALLDSALAEAWRSALCQWLLHYGSSQPRPLPAMARLADLSAYLLTDVEVGSEPRTTRVAAAIASLQQYIHRLYARLEEGYSWNERIATERKAWREWRSQYALWQTYTTMKRHPSGYLDPSRRRSKSKLFDGFEKLVGQGKFASDEIQVALLAYLADFESTSNIQPLSGYHDGVDPQRNKFHFIGRSNVDPAEYYWRTLDMSLRDKEGAPSMLAWGEWERITLPATGVIVQTPLNADTNAIFGEDPRTSIDAVRPVIIAGRRYVVWLERDGTGVAFDNQP
ncbi:MAG: neuraminidase-like domain-containing protein, partial [Luteibacter sp.]